VKQRILLFDTILDGHHPDYLSYLIGYFSGQPSIEVYVVSGESFKTEFNKRQEEEERVWGSNIHFLPINSREIARIHKKSIYLRSFIEWRLMLKYALEVNASHAIIMYFDYFQLGAWLGKRAHLPVSGILFRPAIAGTNTGIYASLKSWILKKALRAGQIKNLFCLVPAAVPLIQAYTHQVSVRELCDPIRVFQIDDVRLQAWKEKLQLPTSKKIYLNFGHLDNRKGIEVFLKACEALDVNILSEMALWLVGPIRPDYQQSIDDAISRVPGLQVIRNYGYLPAPEVQMCFQSADVILAIYQEHVGSSSILVRAAMSEKPVLGSDFGTMGELIVQKELGLALDASSPEKVKEGILLFQSSAVAFSKDKSSSFAQENSIQNFGDTIRQGIES
jgi:glycosyltransferase involved in cell wall biosynthesis